MNDDRCVPACRTQSGALFHRLARAKLVDYDSETMLLGILSDTHDRLARTEAAINLLKAEGAETLIHCGDLTGPAIVTACAVLPLWFVLGNNDADTVRSLEKAAEAAGATCLKWGGEITLAGRRIAVAHGHVTGDLRPLLARKPEFLLTGHTHQVRDTSDGVTRRINPGALHRASRFTVALLDLKSDALRILDVPR